MNNSPALAAALAARETLNDALDLMEAGDPAAKALCMARRWLCAAAETAKGGEVESMARLMVGDAATESAMADYGPFAAKAAPWHGLGVKVEPLSESVRRLARWGDMCGGEPI